MKSSLLALLGSLAGLGLALAACAPDNGTDDDASGSANTADGDDGGDGSGGSTGSFGGQTSTGSLMECASESIVAELAPLTMFITFDKSGSMGDNGKWTAATNALKAFFADPAAAELEVALRFFPEGACDGSTCSVDACATPAVPVGALSASGAPTDAHEAALVAAVDARDPDGGTPISAALEGGIQFSSEYVMANPDHKVVVILVTDGEPNGCEEDIGSIQNIAAIGLLEGVVTYTVGLQGSNEGQLQQIAASGGGSSFVVGNGNAQADLVAALQAIRGEQLACTIGIPTPTMGEFNPMLVNVTYTAGGSTTPVSFGKVDGLSACGPGGGWYYDDPADPQNIELCPATCDTVKVDASGALSVVLGCDSIPG